MAQAIDITGRRYGRWTVIERAEKPKYRSADGAWWRCRCDCGKEKDVIGNSLRTGTSRSCGCLRTDMVRERVRRMKENSG